MKSVADIFEVKQGSFRKKSHESRLTKSVEV
jgi:hypothetical protein